MACLSNNAPPALRRVNPMFKRNISCVHTIVEKDGIDTVLGVFFDFARVFGKATVEANH
jgi:hypothetical protein